MGRQVGVILDRRGQILHVIVGDATRVVLPDLGRQRAGQGRLRGVRLVHTHLRGEPLSHDDLTDLSLLSLDFVVAVTVDEGGLPETVHAAHLLPENPKNQLWNVLDPVSVHRVEVHVEDVLRSLEAEFARKDHARDTHTGNVRAILIHLDTGHPEAEADLAEVQELCASANVDVLSVIEQQRSEPDPRYVVGRGKLNQIVLQSMQLGVEHAIFTRDLTASQARAITDAVELKVLDRTQLILDIFAQRAQSRAGKLQVELAQLKYNLPRLVQKNTGMSRLTGGIGGRGPGETKLELNRRRAKDRIRLLEEELETLCKNREQQRRRRNRLELPVVSIVGYTNAGKSTLLNALTQSEVVAENKLFATLDPTSRRLRFPEEREVIVTDTVGFIRDLPPDLVSAFKATLEELEDADLLLHVIDVSSPRYEEHVEAVDRILSELKLMRTPRLVVLNKTDRIDPELAERLERALSGVAVSAINPDTLPKLTERIRLELWRQDLDTAPVAPFAPLAEAAQIAHVQS
jgi:GTP-binding protein HflX